MRTAPKCLNSSQHFFYQAPQVYKIISATIIIINKREVEITSSSKQNSYRLYYARALSCAWSKFPGIFSFDNFSIISTTENIKFAGEFTDAPFLYTTVHLLTWISTLASHCSASAGDVATMLGLAARSMLREYPAINICAGWPCLHASANDAASQSFISAYFFTQCRGDAEIFRSPVINASSWCDHKEITLSIFDVRRYRNVNAASTEASMMPISRRLHPDTDHDFIALDI